MAEVSHLSNAPITEAIIQIRCNPPDDFDVLKFASCHPKFSDEYPEGEPLTEGSVRLEFQAGRPIKLDQFVDQSAGYRFISSDKLHIAFFRKGSFSFNRLAPYQRWEDFERQANTLWEHYRDCLESYQVNRISTRFINRIELPLPIDFDEYLTAGPKVPEELPQGVVHFATRLHIPIASANALVLLSQTMGTPRDDMHVPIMLDIDVQRECEPSQLPDDEIWSILNTLRQLKNDVFFSSVTDKLVDLYK